MMRACVDCKHFKTSDPIHLGYSDNRNPPECAHPNAGTRDPIYGKALCANERGGMGGKGACGKKGKNWEAKSGA